MVSCVTAWDLDEGVGPFAGWGCGFGVVRAMLGAVKMADGVCGWQEEEEGKGGLQLRIGYVGGVPGMKQRLIGVFMVLISSIIAYPTLEISSPFPLSANCRAHEDNCIKAFHRAIDIFDTQ